MPPVVHSGYVLVNAMVRIASAAGLSIPRCLRRFSAARPPGIYKDAYINDLFKCVCAHVPLHTGCVASLSSLHLPDLHA